MVQENAPFRPTVRFLADRSRLIFLLFVFAAIACGGLLSLLLSRLVLFRSTYGTDPKWGPVNLVIPGSFILSACAPSLDVADVVSLFKVSIVLNQLTFAATSFLTHVNPRNILAKRSTRALCAYILGTCSFVFGAGKVVLVAVVPLLGHLEFPCPSGAASEFSSKRCSDTQVPVPASLMHTSESFLLSSCAHPCGFTVPIECYILSVTFVITWIYSMFMCDQLLHRNETSVEERMEQVREDKLLRRARKAEERAAAAEGKAAQGGEGDEGAEEEGLDEEAGQNKKDDGSSSSSSDEDEEEEADWAKPVMFQKKGTKLQQDLGTALLPMDSSTSLNGGGDAATSSSDAALSSAPHMHARSTAAIRAAHSSAAAEAQKSSSAGDVLLGLDPMSSRALQMASGLSAQELLLAKIESDYRKGLAKELRERDMFYRLLRDSATLAKFVLTVVSLCLLIFNTSPGIIFCDHSPDSSLDASNQLTPQVISKACQPRLGSSLPSFLFSTLGAAMAALFMAIIVVEKRVALPEQSGWLGGALLGGVAVLLVGQLILLVRIESLPLNFPCTHTIPGIPKHQDNGTWVPAVYDISESGLCASLALNVTGGSGGNGQHVLPAVLVHCEERCYLNMGETVYTLFAGLVLSLVYMASLVMRYRQLALLLTHTQRQAAQRMKRILAFPTKQQQQLELTTAAGSKWSAAADADDGVGKNGHELAASPRADDALLSSSDAAAERRRKQYARDVLMAILDKY
jgi:hypothetical protein